MDAHLDALLVAFARLWESEPADLVPLLRGLPEPGVLPSPWNTWTLIGLTRHHKRQLWVAEIIRTRLRGALADLAALGALGHPNGVSHSGPVPGMPDWEYYFHGRGCCINHKIDGDAIDVDFWDDSADYFDTFFYKNYLQSLRRPEPPEQRLRELHPSARAVTIAVTDLLAAGALTPLPGSDSHPYRLADEVMAVADDIDAFCTAWPHPDRRVWLSALIGDWLAADDAAAGRPELTAITAPRAGRCREIRRLRLRRELGEPYRGSPAARRAARGTRPRQVHGGAPARAGRRGPRTDRVGGSETAARGAGPGSARGPRNARSAVRPGPAGEQGRPNAPLIGTPAPPSRHAGRLRFPSHTGSP